LFRIATKDFTPPHMLKHAAREQQCMSRECSIIISNGLR